MCGINGIYNFSGKAVSNHDLRKMNQQMIHRGPDDEGYFNQGNIGLSMRRLSIIDIEGGHQPIVNEDGQITVVQNGEIYNFIELRKKLLKKGHAFKTKSDTEVIVHLFEEMGPDFVKELNGMFAIALWNGATRELFLYRDPIGIKPLYYAFNQDSIIFSSDLSSITAIRPDLKEIDIDSFLYYMGMSYISFPKTIFKKIYKLEPGSYIRIDFNGSLSKKKYWQLNEFETLNFSSIDDYKEPILELLRDSIRLQMRSDVPIGTFLSGGLDSSTVVALLSEKVGQPVRTFSVGFEGGFNELPYAKIVSGKFATKHTAVTMHQDDILTLLPMIIDKMDEPLYDNSIFPTLMLSKIATQNGIKVILNGTGGDEIFGGYNRYFFQNQPWKLISSFPLFLRKILGTLYGIQDYDIGKRIANPKLAFITSVSGINYGFVKSLFKNKLHYYSILNKVLGNYEKYISSVNPKKYELMYFDLNDYLVCDVLSLLDKMTMAVSLEGRVPLLDHRIVELGYKIPDKVKFCNGSLKGLLKVVMKDILPQEIIHLPKAGFAGPTSVWVKGSLFNLIYYHLIEDPIPFYKDFLDTGIIKFTLKNIEKFSRYSESIFALFIFSLWYKKKIQGQKIEIEKKFR